MEKNVLGQGERKTKAGYFLQVKNLLPSPCKITRMKKFF